MHEALAKANFDKDVAVLTPQYAKQAGWTVNNQTFPILDVTANHTQSVRLRLTCDNWNELPPSIDILNPDGTPWSKSLPSGNIFNAGLHPATNCPFICMRGSREYHTHPGHLNDAWDNYRNQAGMSLLGILQQLIGFWRKNVQ
ncbi:MAG TPA: putative metal-binding protein [Candidatus Methylacidiphilales bacterium]|nr:putative metal-binding protein [Candidatus Methylacidiphilales bacterium]